MVSWRPEPLPLMENRVMTAAIRVFILVACLLLAAPAPADTHEEIVAALDYFAEMLNEGDVEALRGFYHPDFKLITPGGLVTLPERMADLEALSASGEDRGELAHHDLKVIELADNNAVAYGRTTLSFKDGSLLEAWFTTVFVKTPFGWKALITHS